jgi:predicted ATP-dependent protease
VIPTATLSPEPIPLNVKVVMIGTNRIFQLLQAADEDFQKLFKSKADFATDVARIDSNVRAYARFVARQVAELGMRPFAAEAVARVVEQSSRMVADQDKLSLRLMDIADLLVEADYWACDAKSRTVGGKHVEQAIEHKIYRSSLVEDRVQEFITNGTIKVDVAGAKVGQVNGLSVFDLGDYSFGRPSRITARVSMGRGQVINRRQRRSAGAYPQLPERQVWHRQPLRSRSLTRKDEVDGDSASSTNSPPLRSLTRHLSRV